MRQRNSNAAGMAEIKCAQTERAARRRVFATIAMCTMLATACSNFLAPDVDDNSGDAFGQLTLRVSGDNQVSAAGIGETLETIRPAADDIAIEEYEIASTDQPEDAEEIEETTEDTSDPSFELDPLLAGDWDFEISGFPDGGDEALVADSIDIEVEAGDSQSVDATPVPVDGEGELDLTVAWDEDADTEVDGAEGTLTDTNDDDEEFDLSFEVSGNDATLDELEETDNGTEIDPDEVPSGFYDLEVTVLDNGDAITTRATNVHMYPGIETEGTVEFSEASLDDEPDEPEEVEIDLDYDDAELTLSWQEPDSALGYRVVRFEGEDEDDESFVDFDEEPIEVATDALDSGSEYSYEISAFNANGESDAVETDTIEWGDADVDVEPWEEDGITISLVEEGQTEFPDSVEPEEPVSIEGEVEAVDEDMNIDIDNESYEWRVDGTVIADDDNSEPEDLEFRFDFEEEDIGTYVVSLYLELDIEGDTKPYEKKRELTVIPEDFE